MNPIGVFAVGNFVGIFGSIACAYLLFTEYSGLVETVIAWGLVALTFMFILSLAHEVSDAF